MADPHHQLFAAYIDVIAELSEASDVEPVLRRFEQSLAAELGYDFVWDQAMDSGQPVEAGGLYCYDPEQGILAEPSPGSRLRNLPGDTLLALADGDLESAECRRIAKRVTRVLVDYLLQGKVLHSRSLFSHHRGDRNDL